MMGDNDPNNSGINSSNNGGMTHQMGSSSGIPTSGSLGGINSSNIINNNNGMVGGSGLPVAGGGLNLGMGVVGMQNPHGGYDPSMVAGGSVVGMQQQQQQQQQGIPGGMQFYQAPPNSLPSTALQALNDHWQKHYHEIDNTKDFKTHELPLARIKKIMKSDEDVKQMISAEAPILFAKACELFIYELTARSWIHTQESKRRTLQKNDIAVAISRTDIFDFLIDIVPREEAKPTTAPGTGNLTANMGTPNSEERGNANNNSAGIQTGVVNQANAQPQLDLQQFLLFHQLNQQQQQGLRPDMSSMLQSPQQQQAANNRQQIPILDQQMYLYLMQQQYMQALQQQPQGTQQQQQGNAEDEYTQNTDNTGDASGVVPNIQSSTDASGVNSTTTLQHGTRPMMGQQQYNPQQYTDNSGSQQDQQVEGGEGTSADQQQGQAYRSF